MQRTLGAPSSHRGFVLPLVLVVLGCLLLLWAAFFALAQTSIRLVRLEQNRRQAYWSARAGALHGLAYAQKHRPVSARTVHIQSTEKDLLNYTVSIRYRWNTADIRSTGFAGNLRADCVWRAELPDRRSHGAGGGIPFRFLP